MDISGLLIRSIKTGNFGIYLMYFECNGCVLGVGTIDGKCFRLEISENDQKRRFRVDFDPTGWQLSKQ